LAATFLMSANYVLQRLRHSTIEIIGVAKHQAALLKETKPYFKCGVAHKSIQTNKTENKNATLVFWNGNHMRHMSECGPAKHQDALSAETRYSLTCGATTYKGVEGTVETESQPERMEDKNATNAFSKVARYNSNEKCTNAFPKVL